MACDEQRDVVLVAQRPQAHAHPLGHIRVERGRGLVEHEQARTVERGLDDPDERALPGGELGAHRGGESPDAEAFERAVDEWPGLGDAIELAVHAKELADAHALGQGQVAGREPDLCERGGAPAWQPVAEDLDPTLVGCDHPEQHHQRRGLARAVRSEQRDARAGLHLEVDAVDGEHAPVTLAQALGPQDDVHRDTLTDPSVGARVNSHRPTTATMSGFRSSLEDARDLADSRSRGW